MHIAVQASDLDHVRIDGTRVYLLELLKRFGKLDSTDIFRLYHRQPQFNPVLTPPAFPNYEVLTIPFPKAWMQTRFALEMFYHKPDKLFLPIQAAPLVLPPSMSVTATIHDLAFKRFPETFPKTHLWKLNFMLETVIRQADKLIAVSESTKRDLLEFFPELPESKIKIIHHGFDREFFGQRLEKRDLEEILTSYMLNPKTYVLYVGALQPRKNLGRLIQAFEKAKMSCPDMKLVLAGEPAWLSEPILKACEGSQYHHDILLTGRVSFATLRALYQGACFFAFPSLYEGFGIPVLEALASGIPVLTARNSSLVEVAGEGACFCDATNVSDIAEEMQKLWQDEVLRQKLIRKGNEQLKQFSWDTCAKETLDYILT